MMDLRSPCRHLFPGATVDDLHPFRAETQGRSGRIHCHVSCAEYGHIPAPYDRGIDLGEKVGFHEVGPCEIFVCRQDPYKVLPRNSQELGQTRPYSHENGIIPLLKELIQGYGPSDNAVAFHLHAEPLKKGYFGEHDLLGEPELGDTVNKNASRFVEGFHDGHLVALHNEVTGNGEA